MSSIVTQQPQRIWFVNEPAGFGAAEVRTMGPISIAAFSNGRLRGNVHASSAGVLVVEQGLVRGVADLQWTVAQDTTQPDFQYPFDIFVDLPFLTITWTQGGAPTTFFRAMTTVMPV